MLIYSICKVKMIMFAVDLLDVDEKRIQTASLHVFDSI